MLISNTGRSFAIEIWIAQLEFSWVPVHSPGTYLSSHYIVYIFPVRYTPYTVHRSFWIEKMSEVTVQVYFQSFIKNIFCLFLKNIEIKKKPPPDFRQIFFKITYDALYEIQMTQERCDEERSSCTHRKRHSGKVQAHWNFRPAVGHVEVKLPHLVAHVGQESLVKL